MYVSFNSNLGDMEVIFLDQYFLVDSLVNHIAAHAAPFDVFPVDYENLTTFINRNANCLRGAQLLHYFDYNGADVLEPYVRQGLVDGIEC